MHNPITLPQFSSRLLSLSASVALGLGLATGVSAATPETAPAELTQALQQIDRAANEQNIDSVMEFYSPNFVHSDGLDRTQLQSALSQLWQNTPQLRYQTQLQSWEQEGNAIIAETVTQITGTKDLGGRPMQLQTNMRSRQRFENQQIVNQEILSERTILSGGNNPPQVQVNLPEQVRIGQSFNFDAIVQEPLGNDLLLGTAIEERVNGDSFLNERELDLELLQAGGIFKMGKASLSADDRWISAVLIRGDGMTIITQRLRVIDPTTSKRR